MKIFSALVGNLSKRLHSLPMDIGMNDVLDFSSAEFELEFHRTIEIINNKFLYQSGKDCANIKAMDRMKYAINKE